MLKAGLCLVLVLSLSLAKTTRADDVEIANDVRCILVGLQVVQSPDPAQQQGAVVMTMYFLGRLQAITPHAELEDQLSEQLVYMSKAAAFQAEAARCGQALKQQGVLVQQVGNRILLPNRNPADKSPSPLP
ncbi:MAG: hypothetical protein ABSF94_14990 [Steroidobacteraceae bacterium]|jgi:hypothetical protein